MILHHALAATDLAEQCLTALVVETDIEVQLDLDPGIDVLGGPGLKLTSAPGEDLDLAVSIIQRILDAR